VRGRIRAYNCYRWRSTKTVPTLWNSSNEGEFYNVHRCHVQ
jgi:hypothetical protein